MKHSEAPKSLTLSRAHRLPPLQEHGVNLFFIMSSLQVSTIERLVHNDRSSFKVFELIASVQKSDKPHCSTQDVNVGNGSPPIVGVN